MQVLLEAGGVCTTIGHNLVQYEVSLEQLVVQQLDSVLKNDLPTLAKERKHLDQLVLELDTAKARLHTARQEEQNAGGTVTTGAKVEKLVEDLDGMVRKVDQARDLLATDMMTFLAKDAELAGLIAKLLSFKLDYHSSITDQVSYIYPLINTPKTS